MITDLGFHDNYCLPVIPKFGSLPVATAALSVITCVRGNVLLPPRCTAHAACNVKALSRPRELLSRRPSSELAVLP